MKLYIHGVLILQTSVYPVAIYVFSFSGGGGGGGEREDRRIPACAGCHGKGRRVNK